MQLFLLNLVLTGLWAAWQGSARAVTLLTGYVLGYLLLLLCRPFFADSSYFSRALNFFRFLACFASEIITATTAVALAVLFRRRKDMYPNIITMDVAGLSGFELVLLSHCITLTPGTTTVDLTEAGDTLYVHAFDAQDPDAVRRSIKAGLLEPILRFTRPC